MTAGSPQGVPQGVDQRDRVAAPATALLVVAIIGLAFSVLILVGNLLVTIGMIALPAPTSQGTEDVNMARLQLAFQGGVGILLGLLTTSLDLIMLFGALRMKAMKSYGFALTAAIIGVIPCYWTCCGLGIFAGIWALVVLLNSEVKAAFGNQKQPGV